MCFSSCKSFVHIPIILILIDEAMVRMVFELNFGPPQYGLCA